MKITHQLMATAALAGFTVFSSASSQATPACKQFNGEAHEISVLKANKTYSNPGSHEYESEVSDLKKENLIRLDERAKMICSGNSFCFDEASIKTDVRIRQFFGDTEATLYVQTKATAHCLGQ